MTASTAGGARIDYASSDWQERLLATRAQILASQGLEPQTRGKTLRCVLVAAGGTVHALPIAEVAQILPWRAPVRIPGRRSAIDGRAGSYFHVYGLAGLLGLPEDPQSGGHIVRLRAFEQGVALHVSRAQAVADLALEPAGPEDQAGSVPSAALALGRAPGQPVIRILDVRRLFGAADQTRLEVE